MILPVFSAIGSHLIINGPHPFSAILLKECGLFSHSRITFLNIAPSPSFAVCRGRASRPACITPYQKEKRKDRSFENKLIFADSCGIITMPNKAEYRKGLLFTKGILYPFAFAIRYAFDKNATPLGW